MAVSVIEANALKNIPIDLLTMDALKEAFEKDDFGIDSVESTTSKSGKVIEVIISLHSGYIVRYYDPEARSRKELKKFTSRSINISRKDVVINKTIHKQIYSAGTDSSHIRHILKNNEDILPDASENEKRNSAWHLVKNARDDGTLVNCLFLCTANYHRSAAMHWALGLAIDRENIKDVEIVSGGTLLLAGSKNATWDTGLNNGPFQSAVRNSLKSVKERHIFERTLAAYERPKPVSEDMVKHATIIIVAGEDNRELLYKHFPDAKGKVFLFSELSPNTFPGKHNVPDPGKGEIPDLNMFKKVRGGIDKDIVALFRPEEAREDGAGKHAVVTKIVAPTEAYPNGQIEGVLALPGKTPEPFMLPLTHAPPSEKEIVALINGSLFSSPFYFHFETLDPSFSLVMETALAWFEDPEGFSGSPVILAPHPSIKWIGRSNAIGVSSNLKDDPTSWLSAILQAAIDAQVINQDDILPALSESGAEWYRSYFRESGQEEDSADRDTIRDLADHILSEFYNRLARYIQTNAFPDVYGQLDEIRRFISRFENDTDNMLLGIDRETTGVFRRQKIIRDSADRITRYRAGQIALDRVLERLKGMEDEIARRIDHVENILYSPEWHERRSAEPPAKSDFEDLRKQLDDARLMVATNYIKNGDIGRAQYILGQLKSTGHIAPGAIEALERAIVNYGKFQSAREAIVLGDAGLAQTILADLRSNNAPENITEFLSQGIEKLRSLPETINHEASGAGIIHDRIYTNDGVSYIGFSLSSGVFQLSEYPLLVFKVTSNGDRARYEKEFLNMSEVAKTLGYSFVVIDGFVLTKIENFAPFAYLNGIIVQALATPDPDMNDDMTEEEIESSLKAAWNFHDRLLESGIIWADVKPSNLGELAGEKLLIDNGFVYAYAIARPVSNKGPPETERKTERSPLDALMESIHELITSGRSAGTSPDNAKILLSETLFDEIDRAHLRLLLDADSFIKIVSPKDIRAASTNENSSRENLVCVLRKEDYDNGELWGANHKDSVKSGLLVLNEDLTGSRYIYLEGIVGLASAMMKNDRTRISAYLNLMFEKNGTTDEAMLLEYMMNNPRGLADYLKFKSILPFVTDELLNNYKMRVENFLINA